MAMSEKKKYKRAVSEGRAAQQSVERAQLHIELANEILYDVLGFQTIDVEILDTIAVAKDQCLVAFDNLDIVLRSLSGDPRVSVSMSEHQKAVGRRMAERADDEPMMTGEAVIARMEEREAMMVTERDTADGHSSVSPATIVHDELCEDCDDENE